MYTCACGNLFGPFTVKISNRCLNSSMSGRIKSLLLTNFIQKKSLPKIERQGCVL